MTAHYGPGHYGPQAAGGPGDATDLVRTVALTSARLWEEVLERLARVEQSHAELREAVALLQAALPAGAAGGPALGRGEPSDGDTTSSWETTALAPSTPVSSLAPAPESGNGALEDEDLTGAAHAARGLTAKDAVDLLFGEDQGAAGEQSPGQWETPDGERFGAHAASEPADASNGTNGSADWTWTAQDNSYAVPEPMSSTLDAMTPDVSDDDHGRWATLEPPGAAAWASAEPSEALQGDNWVLASDEEALGSPAASPASVSDWESTDVGSLSSPPPPPPGFQTSGEAGPSFEPTGSLEGVPSAPPGFEASTFEAVPPPPPGFDAFGTFEAVPPPPPGFDAFGDMPAPPASSPEVIAEFVPPPPPPGFEAFGDLPAPPSPGFEGFGDLPAPPPPPPGFEAFGDLPAPAPPPPPPGFEAAPEAPPTPPPGFHQTGQSGSFETFSSTDFGGQAGFAAGTTTAPPPAAQAEEMEDVPITPDFFARAGRRR